MIIKNAAFTFDLLTNKFSGSKACETIECLNGQTVMAALVLVESWTVTIEKYFGL